MKFINRLTKSLNRNSFFIEDGTKVEYGENGYFGDVVNKLGKFENFYDNLMEKLRLEDKKHSVKFKQLLANKILDVAEVNKSARGFCEKKGFKQKTSYKDYIYEK